LFVQDDDSGEGRVENRHSGVLSFLGDVGNTDCIVADAI